MIAFEEMSEVKEECIGNWVKEKLLGSGGFGMVVLWYNKVSKESIALKQCRWGHDHNLMTPRHRQRWEMEINIMKRLSHLNVVTAVSVPPELDVPSAELPLLAMEYCSGGDLRKLLSLPENCCGVTESEIRTLIYDISSAIEYLHSKRIVHRDLKPENIVLQNVNQKTRYKLIDLGYAKDLDEGSVCTSFVGTLQYLAPELFTNNKYTSTVDYWSFGLVVVECITGLRPFLHSLSPVKWMPYVRQKSPDDICAYVGPDGNVVFSNEIFGHNQISRVFKAYIESWLTLMLEWDPEKRGKGGSNTVQAFSKLNEVLNKKVIHLFCVHLGVNFAFEITDEMTVGTVQAKIAEEASLPVEEQVVISPKGVQISSDKLATEYFNKPEDSVIFIFKKSLQNITSSFNSTLPSFIEKLFADPYTKMKYDEQRKYWSQSVLYAKKELEIFHRVLQAHKAVMTNLLTKNSLMNKMTSTLCSEKNKLAAKHEFFLESLRCDIESYDVQSKNNGTNSRLMYDSWKATMECSLKLKLLSDEAHKLESRASELNSKTVELQRSPLLKLKIREDLDNTLQMILNLYDKLRKLPKDKRYEMNDNKEMEQLLFKFLKQYNKVKNELFQQIQKLSACQIDICSAIDPIKKSVKDIQLFSSDLLSWQLNRQTDIWNLINILSSKSNSCNGTSITVQKSFNNVQAPHTEPALITNGEQNMDIDASNYASMSLSELVSVSSDESLRVKTENMKIRNQIAGMSESLWQRHNEIMTDKNSMDFSFLNDESLK